MHSIFRNNFVFVYWGFMFFFCFDWYKNKSKTILSYFYVNVVKLSIVMIVFYFFIRRTLSHICGRPKPRDRNTAAQGCFCAIRRYIVSNKKIIHFCFWFLSKFFYYNNLRDFLWHFWHTKMYSKAFQSKSHSLKFICNLFYVPLFATKIFSTY